MFKQLIEEQRKYFATGKTKSLDYRVDQLKKLRQVPFKIGSIYKTKLSKFIFSMMLKVNVKLNVSLIKTAAHR